MTQVQPDGYRSKVDWWIAAFLPLPPLAALMVLIQAILGGVLSEILISVAMTFFVGGLYMGVLIPIRYHIADDELIVRSGLIRQRVRLREIQEVHRTRNPLSSPAMSLDRLRIRYGDSGRKSIMISPADRQAFLQELASKSGLEIREDGLRRSS